MKVSGIRKDMTIIQLIKSLENGREIAIWNDFKILRRGKSTGLCN